VVGRGQRVARTFPNGGSFEGAMAEASHQVVHDRAVGDAAGLPLAATLVLAALAVAVVGQGAFYGTPQRIVALLLVAAAAGVWLTGRRRLVELPRTLVATCVLFGGWALCRGALAGDVAAARSTVALLAGALVIIAVCGACDAEQRGQLLLGVVVLGVVVALSGWAGVAWRHFPWSLKDQGLWRAATTITYANVAGGLLAAVALVSLARAVAAGRAMPALAAANCVLLAGLGATLSRGGLVALAAGAVVLVKVLGVGAVTKVALGPLAGAGVVLAGLAPSMPAGSEPRPLLAAAALVAGLLVAAGAAWFGQRTVLLLVLAGACALAVLGGDHVRSIARPRLTAASPDRLDEARAALRLAGIRPLIGVGQGEARLDWVRPDGSLAIARYAHNEYLQVLAELGIVGLALLLAMLAAVVGVVRRGRAAEPVPGAWAGVSAALLALAVHGLLDFGWHVPAVPLTAAALAGLVAFPNRKEQT
jgi:O-antigen ligase